MESRESAKADIISNLNEKNLAGESMLQGVLNERDGLREVVNATRQQQLEKIQAPCTKTEALEESNNLREQFTEVAI
jgi:hypothetical protein